jgi:hypothetical protein
MPALAVLALAATGGLAAGSTALAGGSHSDRIYADSFGNLVVHSRSGYKRIVVGQGHLAQELADYERPRVANDEVVYFDDDDGAIVLRECWRPAVLLKGRSYMYGLEDGELPDLPGRWCR